MYLKIKNEINRFLIRTKILGPSSKEGMELVQAGLLIAIAIIVALIFKTEIISFVNKTLKALHSEF